MLAAGSPGAPRRRPLATAVAVVLAASASLLAGSVIPAGPFVTPLAAAEPLPPPGPADRAARWLVGEISDDTITTGGAPDPGLAADAALALTATGRHPTAAGRLAQRLFDRPDTSVRPGGPGQVLAGGTAKLVLLAVARGGDPGDLGGEDLVDLLLGRRVDAPGATDDGRLRDLPPAAAPTLADRSNSFTQALGVLALARSGSTPGSAVSFLVAQQCPAGGFRLFLTGGRGCTSDVSADADTTALSVLALLEANGSPDSTTTRALDWLERAQQADGSLASSGPGAVANANSTGLAAAAFTIGGRTEAAARARAWIVARQLGCGAGATDVGAVAFTAAAQAAAATGIPATARDQFRRSTSQALLAFTTVPIGSAGAAVPETGAPCDTTPTTSTVPTSPTTTSPTGTVPSSTVPISTVPSSTVPISTDASSTAPTSSVPTTAAVLGVSVTRTPAGSGVVAGSGTRLAATGGTPIAPVLVGLGLLVGGLATTGLTRVRTGRGERGR